MPKIKNSELWDKITNSTPSDINTKSEEVSIVVNKATSNILKETDYSYLLGKHVENYSYDELKYIEKLFTKQDYILNTKRKELINNLKKESWEDFINQIYNRLIKIRLNEINTTNKIRRLLNDENNNCLCWKYKTCNWFWIPFWIEWTNYKTLTKIGNDEIHMLHQFDWDYDDDGIYLYWQYLNQDLERHHFRYDKNKKKYTNLKKIEWERITSILYPVKNKRWKIMHWKYKNETGNIIPFWYSPKLEKYISLKIDWEIICDTANRRRKNWKLIYWTFLNDKWNWLPFWIEWNKGNTIKIAWEEILNTRNRKRDEKWKIISWEFLNKDWIWQKFKLEWWEYIIKKTTWLLKIFKSFLK